MENQDDRSCKNQEKQQEQTNLDQNGIISQTILNKWRCFSSCPKDLILGDTSQGMTTRSLIRNTCEHNTFISQNKPKSFSNTENDKSWIMAL